MVRAFDQFKRFLNDTEGQDLLEYSLLIALIAAVAIVSLTQLGFAIKTVLWENIVAANI